MNRAVCCAENIAVPVRQNSVYDLFPVQFSQQVENHERQHHNAGTMVLCIAFYDSLTHYHAARMTHRDDLIFVQIIPAKRAYLTASQSR